VDHASDSDPRPDPRLDVDEEAPPPDPAGDELLEERQHDELLDRLIGEEMGDEIAQMMSRFRRRQEAVYRREHPDEGLRERKRRLTRQTISDAATAMFATRGFEHVTVSEVARRVGVSEKTIYNYFPTKESMVLDTVDDSLEQMSRALRERGPEESLTEAVLRALEADMRRYDDVADELVQFIPMFIAMIETTAALRAAWLEMYDRLAQVIREELAAQAGVDPRDPEVAIAARSLAALAEVALEARVRHSQEGLRGDELQAAIHSDIQRAARLLETGLWSFELLARGARAAQQAKDLAAAAEQARAQVVSALRQARETWATVRAERQRRGETGQPRGSEQWAQRLLSSQERRRDADRRQSERAAEAHRRRMEAVAAWVERATESQRRRAGAGDDPTAPPDHD
jgi:AcrR family transcriptional regulator